MHAYLKLDVTMADLPCVVEEGLCQLVAFLWLKEGDGTASPLREFFMYSIEQDRSPIYGTGEACHCI